MRTRHLVGLISGVLILSVLLPVGLSIWLAHQQVVDLPLYFQTSVIT
ncbi:hypothetical protein [Shigella flexneri]|nr:hypothetical protein [Shigella flexneri]